MTSMSHDPASAVIGAQLVEMSTAAVAASAAAAPSLTALMPAGAEEISMMASASFAATAEAALAAHVAVQQELAKAGAALIDIARIYAQTDATAASALEANAMQTTLIEAAGFTSTSAGRLLRSEALPGAAGTAARTPLMANLVEGTLAAAPVAAAPATAAPAAVATSSTTLPTVASTMLGAATAPLSSISQLTSMGGAAGGSAAAVPASLTGDDEPTADDDSVGRPGQELA
jgi:PE family